MGPPPRSGRTRDCDGSAARQWSGPADLRPPPGARRPRTRCARPAGLGGRTAAGRRAGSGSQRTPRAGATGRGPPVRVAGGGRGGAGPRRPPPPRRPVLRPPRPLPPGKVRGARTPRRPGRLLPGRGPRLRGPRVRRPGTRLRRHLAGRPRLRHRRHERLRHLPVRRPEDEAEHGRAAPPGRDQRPARPRRRTPGRRGAGGPAPRIAHADRDDGPHAPGPTRGRPPGIHAPGPPGGGPALLDHFERRCRPG